MQSREMFEALTERLTESIRREEGLRQSVSKLESIIERKPVEPAPGPTSDQLASYTGMVHIARIPDILAAIQNAVGPIQAIKAVRMITKLTLKEAKDLVEAIQHVTGRVWSTDSLRA